MKLVITMLIHNKDDIEFVTEFPSFLGHPVQKPGHLGHFPDIQDISKISEKPSFFEKFLGIS